ncbi:uncharacterized protein LOC108674847 [Hyalella azteca]|uniref:Uncharacterized protein LOC108674847 n=1 Tax=Hyalella azteca TaxID=294128 RepID=A0A8B7NWZ0_HYAAZ|nr:uncharacterized protein LOC108674847 [Hyalella azteca]
MPPKGVGKAVSKRCPQCKKQIPVATRLCACGHQFFEERRRSCTALTPPQDSGGDIDEISATASVSSDTGFPRTASPLFTSPPGMLGAGSKGHVNTSVTLAGGSTTPEGGKRRSERVKREKPNFYDALEYDNQMRKARRERQKEEPQPHPSTSGRAKRERRPKNSSPDEEEDDDHVQKEKKRRKKKKKPKKEEEEEDEDIMAGISPYRERSFAYVLSDINHKLGLNNPVFT